MSLLMDALKRAEEAKRLRSEESNTPPTGELQLETVPAPAKDQRNSPLPDLSSHLDSVEAELKAAAEQPGKPNHAKTSGTMDRAVAQNVLTASAAGSARSKAAAPAATGSGRRLFAIIGVGVLAATTLGAYFYLQLQSISQNGNRLAAPGLAAAPAKSIAPAMIAAAPAAAPAPAPMAPLPAVATTAADALATPAPPVAAGKPVQPGGKTPEGSTGKARPSAPAGRPVQKASPPAARPAPSVPAAGTEGLQVSSRSQETPSVRAFNALQGGRFAEAKSAYTQALRENPRDIDALLGLAALARRDGDTTSATELYERTLQNDPRNATAVSGLLALQGNGDPVQAESRLKSLIGLQNSDADATSALHFALGNVYAGQRRWSEAQQAYFKAHTADSGNPDTLYNLAISLEHLNQRSLAHQFYQQALLASRQRAALFSRAEAEKRLAALAP